jgi:hypothetical protein
LGKDDLRDKAEGRDAVFAVFKKSLIENHKPFITLSGDKNLRLEKTIVLMICQRLKWGYRRSILSKFTLWDSI